MLIHTLAHFNPTVLELHKHHIKMNFPLDSQLGLLILRVWYGCLLSLTPKMT